MVKGYICQADILKMDGELVEEKIYPEENSEVARMCLALVHVGWKKRTVKMLSQPIDPKKFNEYWNNLEQGGYFNKDKKHTINIEDLETVPFCLMLAVAKGQLKRVSAD
ncbi:MAG: hypothetical protein NWF06_00705 [Candidatus Bathyarchaeota archaeon]|nr:hypothetical protein [Candidatus Bathyarchaeum sp.]